MNPYLPTTRSRPLRLAVILLPLLLGLGLWPSGPARAADGEFEINQTCATQTGCFPGDTPGFPVTINRAGSYRLTGNLATSSHALTAILITSSDVSVNLGGFTIACTFFTAIVPLGCTTIGSGDGVAIDLTTRERVTVRNGSVRGMGRYGVFVGREARVERLHVADNGSHGISTSDASIVYESTVSGNGGIGIVAFIASIVSGNTVYQNGGGGIVASVGSTVQRNMVRFNGGLGLILSSATAYRENVITGNTTGAVSGGVNRNDNYCQGIGVVSSSCP